ncbi:hypothetical protein L798_05427 [Zootermopsis nevadensis]|uniref:Uncharacterized protein n=1 Tax=Zootermopsis nevadensis TaxID=136037 RepID=A0A067RLD9_ZOONE|nr:hypothetical protein L798_05427 [Zootermopsis nevadensis]
MPHLQQASTLFHRTWAVIMYLYAHDVSDVGSLPIFRRLSL